MSRARAAPLEWTRDGADWPNREFSRFVAAGHLTWHVQRAGQGPSVLLVHGTGASTHSWRDVLTDLARDHDVIAVDLPGHAFTAGARRSDLTLNGMAARLAELLAALDVGPDVLVGHSAGAPVCAQMVLGCGVAARRIVGINGAWQPFPGLVGKIYPALNRLFNVNAALAGVFARRGRDVEAVKRLIDGTGSALDERGIDLYARLFGNRAHVASVLDMMAGWDLAGLGRTITQIEVPLLLIAASDDLAVPAETSIDLARRLGSARFELVRGGGHLLHEVAPDRVADLIRGARCSVA